MTTLTLLRAAASRSVRPPVHFASLTPVTSSSEFSVRWRRYYATENNSESNTKDEQAEANAKKDGEAAATSAENGEQLEDKDKKIAELKVSYRDPLILFDVRVQISRFCLMPATLLL